jgi:hypothetical protein
MAYSTWLMIEKASKTPYPPVFFSCAVPFAWFWLGLVLVLAVVSVRVCMLVFAE